MNPATNRQWENRGGEFTLMPPAGEGLCFAVTNSAGSAEQSGDSTDLTLGRRAPANSAQKLFPA